MQAWTCLKPTRNDGEPSEEKVARLTTHWREQQAEAQKLDAAFEANLKALGFEARMENEK